MAWFETKFKSQVLGMATTATVIVPQAQTTVSAAKENASQSPSLPVLFLLHGLSDDHSTWGRRTCIERYAEELGIAVVMPEVHRSFYLDTVSGRPYFRYLVEELPGLMRSFFPLASESAKTWVAGFSMGGYGAFRAALLRPDVFSAAVSLSGVMDLDHRIHKTALLPAPEAEALFGPALAIAGTDFDLFHLIAAREQGVAGQRARFLQICGDGDHLLDGNRRFRDAMQQRSFTWSYDEVPGQHNWAYCERMIPHVLAWLAAEDGKCQ